MLERKIQTEVETEAGIDSKPKSSKLKSYLVDTIGMWAFFQPMKIYSELCVGGLDSEEFVKSRIFGFASALIINYPVLKAVDWYAEKVWKINKNSSRTRKIASDLTFALPLATAIYAGVLATAGAEKYEILKTIGANIPLSVIPLVLAGRPYMNWLRGKFNTTPDYLLKDNIKNSSNPKI